MKKSFGLLLSLLLIMLVSSCSAPVAGATIPLGKTFVGEDDMTLTKVSDHVWIFTSFFNYNGSPTPANGMLIATSTGFVMVDTPWTDSQTESLLKLIEKQFGKKVELALFTHAHIDRIGGIKELQSQKIKAISTELTAQTAVKNGFLKPEISITQDIQAFDLDGVRFEAYYPGKGHTADNITVWVPSDKVLFAGCIVKSMNAENLGETADADVGNWPSALDNLKKRYSDAAIVIPGHGDYGGMELLDHTLKLFK